MLNKRWVITENIAKKQKIVINFFRDLQSQIFLNSVTTIFFRAECLKVCTGTYFVTKKPCVSLSLKKLLIYIYIYSQSIGQSVGRSDSQLVSQSINHIYMKPSTFKEYMSMRQYVSQRNRVCLSLMFTVIYVSNVVAVLKIKRK